MTTPTTSAAILAGGRARRLGGQDKSRLVVEGRTIIVRQVEILQRVTRDLFIVGDTERFGDLGLPTHPDLTPGVGAIAGLLTALHHAAEPRVLVVACDMPYLNGDLLLELVVRSVDHDGAWVRTERGVEPLLACYATRNFARIRERVDAGLRKLSDLEGVIRMATLEGETLEAFGRPERLVANVNTPDDYARVQ